MYFDPAFVFLFALVYPIVGYVSFQRLLRRVAAGETVPRWPLYQATLAGHWALFVIALLLWNGQGRSLAMLGFGWRFDVWFGIAAALTLAGIALLVAQLRTVRHADQELLGSFRDSFGSLVHILPHTKRELAGFSAVAITAGIVEELLWRGYLIWFLSQYLPLWAAALISTIGFGVAHAYQGAESIVKITVVGAVFTGIFILSGSLWLPIILHAAIDLLQGRMAYTVITRHVPSQSTD